ncbi:hypothetical protein PAPYR_4675 [Paratrimastix pyriformis]|uniref:Uncharacterized protein n=1 Tax=Paratrimastix pyriformis TaxID=342808 RepID=A0ABQ8UJI4_9EUKA|nr:hypothetical protein PAPYR_4675 [Paratrimastix pyriformis]
MSPQGVDEDDEELIKPRRAHDPVLAGPSPAFFASLKSPTPYISPERSFSTIDQRPLSRISLYTAFLPGSPPLFQFSTLLHSQPLYFRRLFPPWLFAHRSAYKTTPYQRQRRLDSVFLIARFARLLPVHTSSARSFNSSGGDQVRVDWQGSAAFGIS